MSVVAGFALAAGYQLFASRSHRWLSFRTGKGAALLGVGSMLLRLTLVGAVLVIVATATPLQALPLSIAFVGLFSLLSLIDLVRFAQGKGPFDISVHAE